MSYGAQNSVFQVFFLAVKVNSFMIILVLTEEAGSTTFPSIVYFPFSILLFSQRISIHQFISVTQSCPALCNPVDCSTPGFPVHYQLLKFAQTHVH